MQEADSQPDNTGGCMIALYPTPRTAKTLTVSDGLPPDEIHLTVAYTGKAADVDPVTLNTVAAQLARRGPVTASVSGHARFTGGDTDVIVALADGSALEDLRRDALDQLGAAGIAVPRDHGYTPHLTLRYAGPDDPDPIGRLPASPLEFAGISAVHGKTRTDYPFGGDTIASRAREAYAAGWAISGGPMTDRVRAGCTAAVEHALRHADDPRVLEVTLDLGKLEGTWAEVYKRREDLTADHVARITKTWRKLARRLNPRDPAARWRRIDINAAEAEGPGAWRAAEARQAALGWLYGILSDPDYEDLAEAITAALKAAAAEGRTAALAVAADQAGHLGFDWAKAYASQFRGLADLPSLPGMADPWVQRILGGAAADVGRILTGMSTAGATDSEMAAAVMDVISGEDVQAVDLMIDYAMGGSMSQAALDLYASEGSQSVSWLSAGDGRVCITCQDNEDNSPYVLSAVPDCPAHPRCRCALTSTDVLPVSAFADFLVPTG